ncbi:MAG: T9SS type A sorting domain-containing protein, partial [Crocinitomicaceae bacterium]|nr:T9SS type A sorting domain-containing protein [Crocinitomicaceae bacterium]
HLELDNLLGFLGADVAPDSVVGQNIYWHFDSLFYFGESMFDAMIQMPSFLLTLEDMSSILTVYLLDDSDSIIYVSSDTLDQILWCSYDPNDKAVTPQGIGSSGYILANQDLEYLVRFQNTGNYFATDVIITDQLDPDLDWYSIEPIASSHPMTVHIDPGGEAVFEFKNIMLPDSNSNEPESHGFVKYRIKQKPDLPPGTQFTNSASIFFDLNEPVITNGVLNTIYNCDALTMSITNNLACQNELIEGELVDIPGNTIWQVDSFYTVTSSNLAWSPDTSGTFQLHMTYSNELCSKDSMLQITIHPTSENTTEHSICDNDSILIHGNYENTSGTYVQTLETVLGCDSLLITNLYVKPSYNFQNIYSICEGDSMLFFSNYVSTAGTYYDTLISVEGCDSIFTNTLIVNQGYSANNNVMLCQGDSLLFNGSYLNSSGTYFESLQTVNGCDSIISLDLTVNPSYNFDTSTEICHGDSIQLFGTYQSTAGTYEEIFQTNSGCDSIFSTELIVNPAYHFVQVFSIRNGDSLYIHDHYETVSGIYTELNVTTNGCDSNYTSILEVGSNFELVQNLEICSGDSLFAGGEFQYGDGIFIDSLLTTFGCDSVVTTNLVVNSTPSVLLNEFFEDSICLDYGLITLPPGFPSGGVYSGSGVNAGSFDPMLAGEGLHLLIYSYTSNENCTNSDSTQIYITNCAAAKSFSQIGIIAYPNPTTGLITLEKSNIFDDDIHLNVYDSRTALVLVQVFDGPSVTLDLTNLSDGVFFIELRTQDGIYFEKFIKN